MASSKGFRSASGAPAPPGRRTVHDAEAPRAATAISRRSAIAAAVAGIGGAAALTGCSPASSAPSDRPSDATTGSTFAFDTFCTFTVYGDDEAPAKLSAACARYDKLFDLYDPASDIARVNDAGGAATAVDRETAELVAEALAFCASARGLFDITVGAVSTLWDFEKGIRPADDSIADALQHVDWKLVDVDVEASTVRLADPAAKIDLGGIAKGFIADRLCKLLADETTATGAALSLGGNIAYFGSKPDGTPWNTGIRDPNDPGGSRTVGTAHLDGGSLVTSGLYERTFELDGETYWHILDPRTGMPVATDTVSVTVACPSSTTADALSTTLFVAGSHDGAALADAHEKTAAYFIKDDGSTAESSKWQELTSFEA